MQSSRNLVVLLQPWAATKDFWQPELPDGTLHVANFSLRWRGSLDPLRGLSTNTTNHISVGERLGRPLRGLDIQC